MGNTTGFCKVIVTSDSEKRLLGVRAFGVHAGSIIEVASLSIRRLESAYELLKLTPSYPSAVQGLVECIRMILGRSALKPNTTQTRHLKSGTHHTSAVGASTLMRPGYEESVTNSDDVKIARK
ncbi:hypothetical protein TcBrA4_0065580 [Trypanosoma cruzi]|nr:hypothetical protein TcBrA4_0065580 [Trypanosoma cruzi]